MSMRFFDNVSIAILELHLVHMHCPKPKTEGKDTSLWGIPKEVRLTAQQQMCFSGQYHSKVDH